MSYFIAGISNGGGAPEQAYRKMQAAGACPEKPFAGKFCFRQIDREKGAGRHLLLSKHILCCCGKTRKEQTKMTMNLT
jgi:hypothetical protein